MAGNVSTDIIRIIKDNLLAFILALTGLGLALLAGQPFRTLPATVDWNTIFTLSGLLVVTTGVKESGLFYLLAYRISKRIGTERRLALFLVFATALLAMFLTNDIALFITVPLTLNLQQVAGEDYSKIIIFEAIGANVGSSLTPIGNPQNIFLWHQWGISFPAFTAQMASLVLIAALCLLAFTLACFPGAKIPRPANHPSHVNKGLFILCGLLMVMFIFSIELGYEKLFLPVILVVILLAHKKIIFRSDWGLIFLFIVIFVNVDLVCRFDCISHLIGGLDLDKAGTLFATTALLSQVISNVPTALLLAHHSADYKIIAYGVSIGGNGFLIASFANLIALRISGKKSAYLSFHAYSIPFFIVTLVISYCLLIRI